MKQLGRKVNPVLKAYTHGACGDSLDMHRHAFQANNAAELACQSLRRSYRNAQQVVDISIMGCELPASN